MKLLTYASYEEDIEQYPEVYELVKKNQTMLDDILLLYEKTTSYTSNLDKHIQLNL